MEWDTEESTALSAAVLRKAQRGGQGKGQREATLKALVERWGGGQEPHC